jgi:hypothetical protein
MASSARLVSRRDAPKFIVGLGVIRFELDGLPVRGDGLVGLAQPMEGVAEIVVRYGVILLEVEGGTQ